MRRCGVILFHSNLLKIYEKRWVDKCLDSIRAQTFQDFTVYELCYSDAREQIWEGSEYSHIPMPNHIHALNHILDKAFLDGCDVVFGINADDFYSPDRFRLQLDAIEAGNELISSNFQHIEDIDGIDVPVRDMNFSHLNIKEELDINHNVLCHSVIAYTKKFWEENRYYDVNSIGFEDRDVWKAAINKGCKIYIIPQILCYYRLSPLQTGRINPAK